MKPHRAGASARFWTALVAGLAAGCGGTTQPNGNLATPSEACVGKPVTQLAPSDHVVLDPATNSGCLRLPAAGAGGAQYLLVLASTNGDRSSGGVSGAYLLRASNPAAAAAAPDLTSRSTAAASASAVLGGGTSGSLRSPVAAQFDATLRERERELLADPRYGRMAPAAPGVAAPPPLGDSRSFKVCTNLTCTTFATVTAVARYVGQHVAIYVDTSNPQSDPLQDSDLADLGNTFDTWHYPADTTAFGRESDQDGNGVVIILMTIAVNNLTPDCSGGRVIGYFFGGDLLTGANSNRAELFYTLVPAPATAKCSVVSRSSAINNLKPTLIHEFQHMISFNQHALLRGGNGEDTWLNEALSHFAEELGGRVVPEGECTAAGFSSCRAQYAGGDILNAYDYLRDPESHYMVFPNSETGTLAERGAAWLFLRWTLDQFSTDTILATATTRALDGTALTGLANLTAVTGGSFRTMVPEWLMALFLDDGSDLPSEPTGRLHYKSWGFRAIYTDPRNAATFPQGFPLLPTSIFGGFTRSGTLRAGSGHHFLIAQSASGPAVDLQVLKSTAGDQLDPLVQARFGIVRIR